MNRTSRLTAAFTIAFIVATTPVFARPASTPQAKDLTAAFAGSGLTVDRLQVFEIGGIVVIRGRAASKAQAADAARVAQQLGFSRVANLVQVIEAPDDRAIEQQAERELTTHRSLDGCKFRVDSDNGILTVGGQVIHELQKDVALQLLRNVDGVRELRTDLQRF